LSAPSTVNIATTLFSRCLENELKPDRLQFTKFLYLVDYCNYRFKGEQATDIEWVFFHYGPWAFEMPNIMNAVMDVYPVGWEDRTEEFGGHMPRFDPIKDKLGLTIENIITRVINAFKDRTTNDVIEWCYQQTEPMRNAHRGEKLNFETIAISREMPVFFPKPTTWDMPKVPQDLLEKRRAFRAKRLSKRKEYLEYKKNLESSNYMEGMQVLEERNSAEIPDLSNACVTWDEGVVKALGEKDD